MCLVKCLPHIGDQDWWPFLLLGRLQGVRDKAASMTAESGAEMMRLCAQD